MYNGVERRQEDPYLAEVRKVIERAFEAHELAEEKRLREALDELKSDAFPDGISSHKAAHQAMIDREKAEADFWRSLKTKFLSETLAGALKLTLMLILGGLALKLGIPALDNIIKP